MYSAENQIMKYSRLCHNTGTVIILLEFTKHTESMFTALDKVIGCSVQVDPIQHLFIFAEHH